ncbi:hypothetical protein OG233_11050 [Streptomyces sp. NBC_01218]|uniref:hypothetical protein n=1 Tax=unclassified Streptomyces TaxID=2593676 RepID=UPI0023B9E375|nr:MULTISPECIES: hypothetical protein [unclassified Streptomyces]WEH39982.1 hypothetical protein PZB77_10895 [Streptomyces sp. AM 2-1-1]WSQ51673.1 hypothetical protein OG233_11050 [Streptomyces sp. NBC_01218]
MVRRPVAVVTALVLLAEAVGVGIVNTVLATVAENQNMSLAGLEPGAMSTGAWVMGGVSAALLVSVALVALTAGVRDRSPGRAGRFALIATAVVHGLLGALAVGLIGWFAFASMMVTLALLVGTLIGYDPARHEPGAAVAAGAGGAPDAGGTPAPVVIRPTTP